jgi:hypothetical protein
VGDHTCLSFFIIATPPPHANSLRVQSAAGILLLNYAGNGEESLRHLLPAETPSVVKVDRQ